MAILCLSAIVVCLLALNRGGESTKQIKLSGNSFTRDYAIEASLRAGKDMLGIDVRDYSKNKTLRQDLLSVIDQGTEAWISNVAEFSRYVSYHGCWKNMNITSQAPLVYNNLYESFKADNCKGKYVGLNREHYFCFSTMPGEQFKLNDSLCNETCTSFFNEPCGGENAISLYEVIKGTDIDMGPTEPQFKQCVILNKPSAGEIKWSTESCYGYCDSCQYVCSPCDDASQYHVSDGTSSYTWTQAQRSCTKQNKCVIMNQNSINMSALAKHMDSTRRYWTGVFRTFKTTDLQSPVGNHARACVFVRKNNNALEFETTKCSAKKQYLYLEDIPTPKSTTESTRAGTTTQIHTTIASTIDPGIASTASRDSSTTTTRSSTEGSAIPPDVQDNTDHRWTIAAIVSSTAAVIVIVIAVIVVCRKKMAGKTVNGDATRDEETFGDASQRGGQNDDLSQPNQNRGVSSPSLQYDSILTDDIDQDYAEIPDDQIDDKAKLSAPIAGMGADKLSPRKPERRTLKMKQNQSDDASVNGNEESAYNVLNEIQTPVNDRETCNVYSHLNTHTGSDATQKMVSDTDNVYDHTGMQSASSGVRTHFPEESNEYSSLANAKDNAGPGVSSEGVYDHTFEQKKTETMENTYSKTSL